MKRLFMMLAAAGMLVATSCSKETITEPTWGEGDALVTFTAQVPNVGTRAEATYGNGETAERLVYCVFDENWTAVGEGQVVIDDAFVGDKLSTTVSMRLVSGKSYNFIFWADANKGYYTFSNLTNIQVNGTYVANDEARDAFYATIKGLYVNGTVNQPVELRRPFAQLNMLTADFKVAESMGYTLAETEVVAPSYTAFDLVAEEVAGDATDITFAMNARAKDTYVINGIDYEFIAMNYLLVPADETQISCTLKADNGYEQEFHTVPVERNHRTNLYGNLLTDPANFSVTILPDFDKDDHNRPYFDDIADGVGYDPATQTVYVSSAEGLKWFAQQTDGATRAEAQIDTKNGTFANMTIKLTNDIDLSGVANWVPISSTASATNGKIFNGTFDGDGYTIKNLNITKTDKGGAGLFASSFGVIKNLNIENVNIKAHYKAGAIVGDGLCSKIENCHVKGGNIVITPLNNDDGNHAGGITGYLSAEPQAYLKNCSVENVVIMAYRDVGGLIGTVTGSGSNRAVVENNVVRNVEVVANQLHDYVEEKEPNVDYIIGRCNYKEEYTTQNNSYEQSAAEVLKINENNVVEFGTGASFNAIADYVSAGNDMQGITILLTNDINLRPNVGESTAPIGSSSNDAPFRGTFDGGNHTVSNLNQSGWDLGYDWYNYGSIGMFAELDNAVVKNVTLDNFNTVVEGGDVAFIAGSTTGDCTFENITIQNCSAGTYNNGIGSIIGWSGAGNYTLKNINIASDVVVGGLWGSFDSSIGGLIGQADENASYLFEDVNVACRIDAYNDVTASYKWYSYRMCGMLVGRVMKTQVIDGRNVPDPAANNIVCRNVTATYGEWMNYHYCFNSALSYGCQRVEPGFEYGGIDPSFDHSSCTTHEECIPFDQLFGGPQSGKNGYYGLAAYEGVTVIYPQQ